MNRTLRACLPCLASALMLAATCPAADTPATAKYRQANMKALGGHMSAAAALLKGEVDQKPHLDRIG